MPTTYTIHSDIQQNHVRLGNFDTNEPNARSFWIHVDDYDQLMAALRSKLSNGTELRATLRAACGEAFDAENDDWLFALLCGWTDTPNDLTHDERMEARQTLLGY